MHWCAAVGLTYPPYSLTLSRGWAATSAVSSSVAAGGVHYTPLHLMGCVDSTSEVTNNLRGSKEDKHPPPTTTTFHFARLFSPYVPPSSIPSPLTCNTRHGRAMRLRTSVA